MKRATLPFYFYRKEESSISSKTDLEKRIDLWANSAKGRKLINSSLPESESKYDLSNLPIEILAKLNEYVLAKAPPSI